MIVLTQYPWLRYLISGGLSACIEYGAFLILFSTSSKLLFSNSISFLIGLLISFWLHKVWSFGGAQAHRTRSQFLGYVSLAAINLLLANILIAFLVGALTVPAVLAKIIVMGCIVIWNFIIMKKILFA